MRPQIIILDFWAMGEGWGREIAFPLNESCINLAVGKMADWPWFHHLFLDWEGALSFSFFVDIQDL